MYWLSRPSLNVTETFSERLVNHARTGPKVTPAAYYRHHLHRFDSGKVPFDPCFLESAVFWMVNFISNAFRGTNISLCTMYLWLLFLKM